MIQLTWEHNGKIGSYGINVSHIVYFEAMSEPINEHKTHVYLTTKQVLQVCEDYSTIWAMLEAHKGK